MNFAKFFQYFHASFLRGPPGSKRGEPIVLKLLNLGAQPTPGKIRRGRCGKSNNSSIVAFISSYLEIYTPTPQHVFFWRANLDLHNAPGEFERKL